jgi:predicted nuclease with TOPRIM domain
MTLDELLLGLKEKVVVLTKEELQLRRDLDEATSRYDELLTVANDWRVSSDEWEKIATSLKNECIRQSTRIAELEQREGVMKCPK